MKEKRKITKRTRPQSQDQVSQINDRIKGTDLKEPNLRIRVTAGEREVLVMKPKENTRGERVKSDQTTRADLLLYSSKKLLHTVP